MPGPAWISLGTLADGHIISIEVTGVLPRSEQFAFNTIGSVVITDGFGVDVTENYFITFKTGVLQWLDI